jgi:hypothetical protein
MARKRKRGRPPGSKNKNKSLKLPKGPVGRPKKDPYLKELSVRLNDALKRLQKIEKFTKDMRGSSVIKTLLTAENGKRKYTKRRK